MATVSAEYAKCDFVGRDVDGGALRQDQCALNFQELRKSRQVIETKAGRQYVLTFICIGTNNEELVRCRAEDVNIGVYPIFRHVPLSRITLNCLGHETWEVIAEYGFVGPLEASQNPGIPGSLSFSTTGGSQTITRSLSSESVVYEDDRAVGYDGQKVNGVDVVVPKTRWSEVWLFDMQEVFNVKSPSWPTYTIVAKDSLDPCTNSKVTVPNTLYNIWKHATGTVNRPMSDTPSDDNYDPEPPYNEAYDGSFRGSETGEVLFLGVTARNVSHYRLECTFEFEFARNRHFCFTYIEPDDESTTDDILVFAKGFDYVEYRWANKGKTLSDGNSGSRKAKVPIPYDCIVHQVYPDFDFRRLGIGALAMTIDINPISAPDSIFVDELDCSHARTPYSGQHEKAGVGWDNAGCNSAPA